MQRIRGCAPDDEHSGRMQLQRREKELVAQLHELLFPSTSPSPSSGASWSSSSSGLAIDLSGDHCSSPVKPTTSCAGGNQRRRGCGKRARGDERHKEGRRQHGGAATAPKAIRCRRKKQGTTTRTLVTTVPDFDGYQWRKYGQKQIEGAKHARSYYRCTNSTTQGCPAKRTVQRSDDHGSDDGRPKYTVLYISEHSCKATESAAVPVILETTVRTNNTTADVDVSAVPGSRSSGIRTETQSPASSSDITWSSAGSDGGANLVPRERDDYSRPFDVEDDCWGWCPSLPASAPAAALLQEMDFSGPIRSPVHVATADGSWINDLFVNEPPFVLNSCHLFGF